MGTKSGHSFALSQHFDRPQVRRPKRPERHRLSHQCCRRLSRFGLSFQQGSRHLEERKAWLPVQYLQVNTVYLSQRSSAKLVGAIAVAVFKCVCVCELGLGLV